MDIRDTYQFIVLAVLLALSAFFSSIETALMSVNRIRLRTLSDDGNKRAALALDILENKTPKMLSAILIGNNIVNVYASSLATTLAYHLGGYMVSIATLALTVAILVFGEITPKNYATLNSEKLTLRYITVIHFLMTLMTPVIFVINLISRFFLYILHVDPDAVNKAMTEEELRTIVDVSHEDGVIESDEKKMIYNVFDFGDSQAKDVMVPRIDMEAVDIDDTSIKALTARFVESKYSRIFVWKESVDNIVGYVNSKSLFRHPTSIDEVLMEVQYVPETMPLQALMQRLIRHKSNIAVVIDEFGGTAGIISLEDVLEQIFGEIEDEHDVPDLTEKQVGDSEFVLSCRLEVEYLNEKYGLAIPESDEYETLAGYIIFRYEGLPAAGETVRFEHLEIKILRRTRSRLELARVKRL